MSHGSSQHRIVLVTDNEVTLTTIAIPLMQAGITVCMAQEIQDVLDQVDTQPWDAILIDLTPVERSIALVAQLKPQSQLSTILLTAPLSSAMISAGIAAGAYDWLFKPLDMPLLQAAIQRAHERRILHKHGADHATPNASTMLAHDINNHLAGIIGLVQLHLNDPTLPAELRDDLVAVLTGARHIHELVRRADSY